MRKRLLSTRSRVYALCNSWLVYAWVKLSIKWKLRFKSRLVSPRIETMLASGKFIGSRSSAFATFSPKDRQRLLASCIFTIYIYCILDLSPGVIENCQFCFETFQFSNSEKFPTRFSHKGTHGCFDLTADERNGEKIFFRQEERLFAASSARCHAIRYQIRGH